MYLIKNKSAQEADMESADEYICISINMTPDVFKNVITVKELIAKNGVKNLSEACKKVGISRSAFYKYKDHVFKHSEKDSSLLTIFMILSDDEGVLTRVLGVFSKARANILTINQNLPQDGAAQVTVTIRTENLIISRQKLIEKLKKCEGTAEIRIIK